MVNRGGGVCMCMYVCVCVCVRTHTAMYTLSCYLNPLLRLLMPQGLLRLNLLDAVECALKSDER